LHVLDGSQPMSAEDEQCLAELGGKKRILVRNKVDLPQRLVLPQGMPAAPVCCLTGKGIEELKDGIKEKLWSGEIRAEMLEVMINARHQDALRRALQATRRTAAALRQSISLDLAAVDLRAATNAIGEIAGKTATEDLLDSIFSQFCIGK
jgi:tRNA modification GTPase